jgi:hypothetical protein
MTTFDRVRSHTSPEINHSIDRNMEKNVSQYATLGGAEITRRIEELDREWDIERWLEMNASALSFIGVILAAVHSKIWLILPGIVLSFLFLHAIQGWCPPVPLLRRFGVRTRKEIDCEKYALKVLRGDFKVFSQQEVSGASLRSEEILMAMNE